MAVEFNHTIIWARESKASATFLAEVLGLPAPVVVMINLTHFVARRIGPVR